MDWAGRSLLRPVASRVMRRISQVQRIRTESEGDGGTGGNGGARGRKKGGRGRRHSLMGEGKKGLLSALVLVATLVG